MSEIVIKFDVPHELEEKFELALVKVVNQFVRRMRFLMIDEIMSKSELTEEQVKELTEDMKKRVAKRHGL